MKVCQACGSPIERGTGYHSAKLCVGCWVDILVRLEKGERQADLAREYGLSESTIFYKKLAMGG